MNVIAGIKVASQTSNCGAMRFGFLKNDNAVPTNNDEDLVTWFEVQGLTRLTRDHNLVL